MKNNTNDFTIDEETAELLFYSDFELFVTQILLQELNENSMLKKNMIKLSKEEENKKIKKYSLIEPNLELKYKTYNYSIEEVTRKNMLEISAEKTKKNQIKRFKNEKEDK